MFAAQRLLRSRPLVAAASAAAATAAATAAVNTRPAESASWFSSKPKVELKYFKIAGVAETIRMVMALGECEWTETAWPIDFSKFPPSGPSPAYVPIAAPKFAEAREAGELDVNCGRAPVVIIDGKDALGQSKTIERYLARRLGLFGANEIEAAQIDMITEHARDIKDKYKAAKGDKEKEKALAEFFDTWMPEFMEKVEKSLPPASGPGLIGKKLSLADVTLYVLIKEFFDNKAGAAAAIDKCPKLKASVAATAAHPGVAKYLANRK